ncbi:MAG: SEC59/DGK1/VTE5 family protein [Candidatus Methanomethylophilaceae archaeon]|jgi:phytol kinase|nr:SEC59/DGK1/VTE5 family protein [Candidatus Methanomethylophilaceae archaeon]NLF33723.1 hypothetical protein [Thermoplasmatales archaeon]
MTADDIIALLLVYSLIGATLATYIILERRGSGLDTRKVVHIMIGNFVFVWWMFSESWIMLVFFVLPFGALVLAAAIAAGRGKGGMVGDMSLKGHRLGLFFYVISIGVLASLFPDHLAAASVGIVAMTYGDGFGSIIGKAFGKRRMLNGKTLEGSLGVFAATAVMTLVVVGFYCLLASWNLYAPMYGAAPVWMLAPAAGVCAAVLEAVTPGDYDNLTIPIVTAALMFLLGL